MADEKTKQISSGVDQKTLLILITCIILTGGLLLWQKYEAPKGKVLINTDKTEYEKDDVVRVKIQNIFGQNICFSSCYPYFLEKKTAETLSNLPPRKEKPNSANKEWEPYQYVECQEFNSNGHCIGSGEEKTFELALPEVPAGPHRLAIPVCLGCKMEDTFRKDKEFYSNEFLIK